jgi:hypothetical protein
MHKKTLLIFPRDCQLPRYVCRMNRPANYPNASPFVPGNRPCNHCAAFKENSSFISSSLINFLFFRPDPNTHPILDRGAGRWISVEALYQIVRATFARGGLLDM